MQKIRKEDLTLAAAIRKEDQTLAADNRNEDQMERRQEWMEDKLERREERLKDKIFALHGARWSQLFPWDKSLTRKLIEPASTLRTCNE